MVPLNTNRLITITSTDLVHSTIHALLHTTAWIWHEVSSLLLQRCTVDLVISYNRISFLGLNETLLDTIFQQPAFVPSLQRARHINITIAHYLRYSPFSLLCLRDRVLKTVTWLTQLPRLPHLTISFLDDGDTAPASASGAEPHRRCWLSAAERLKRDAVRPPADAHWTETFDGVVRPLPAPFPRLRHRSVIELLLEPFLLVRNGTRVVVRPIARLAALRDLQGAQECAGQSLCAALEAWMCGKEWRGPRQNMGSLVERARRWGVWRVMGARLAVEETDRILDGGRAFEQDVLMGRFKSACKDGNEIGEVRERTEWIRCDWVGRADDGGD